MNRVMAWILGKDAPERTPERKRRRTEDLQIDRGPGEVSELKEALRQYAREAARSAAARDGLRDVEALKRSLRERAEVLAERERALDEREQELDRIERELRGSRRRKRSSDEGGGRRRRPSAEPAYQDSD
jgi:hypothetical protein